MSKFVPPKNISAAATEPFHHIVSRANSIGGENRCLRFELPLAEPPQIVQMGISVHGRREGASVDEYRLPNLWCVHIYQYEATLELDGQAHALQPGIASVIAPGVKMRYRYKGLSEHCYCHFRAADRDAEETMNLPALMSLGSDAPRLYERFARVALQLPSSSSRHRAFLWDLLWTLASTGEGQRDTGHPALEKAVNLIERRFAETLSVAEIAKACGVSYSYLSRLFQAELGSDVIGHIRQRRSRHAEHLLRSSTLPIKAIAASVGLHDLTQFNRLIHRTCGCSPTEVRRGNLM